MFWRARKIPTVTFATSCWEKDWKKILLDPIYLKEKLIENHAFAFDEKLLVINNVSDFSNVAKEAKRRVEEGTLTRVISSLEKADEILSFFQLKRSDFRMGRDAGNYEDVTLDWIYYNALAPLAAIYECKSDYLLYVTGDVYLNQKISWILKALAIMEKNPKIKVANLTWNSRFLEAKKESYRKSWNFYFSKEGFSDQMFLIKRADFQRPVYGEIRPDSTHFPRGDVFEKRVFSYMKNREWERITYRWGSYIHENI